MIRKFLNQFANLIMKPLLASPLHIFASGRILLLSVTGRKSGKVYTTPLEYMREGNEVTVFTQKERLWWRNMKGGAEVQLRLKGRQVKAFAEPYTNDEMSLSDAVRRMYPFMSDTQRANIEAITVCIKMKLQESD